MSLQDYELASADPRSSKLVIRG